MSAKVKTTRKPGKTRFSEALELAHRFTMKQLELIAIDAQLGHAITDDLDDREKELLWQVVSAVSHRTVGDSWHLLYEANLKIESSRKSASGTKGGDA